MGLAEELQTQAGDGAQGRVDACAGLPSQPGQRAWRTSQRLDHGGAAQQEHGAHDDVGEDGEAEENLSQRGYGVR